MTKENYLSNYIALFLLFIIFNVLLMLNESFDLEMLLVVLEQQPENC